MTQPLRVLTEDALLMCAHPSGKVKLDPVQNLVTIAGRRALIRPDPESRPISGCAMYGPTIKPCTVTLKVKQGYSTFITVAGQPLCLESVRGLTDGTPQGAVDYDVREPGQQFVTSTA